jgi:predicted peroxiredoxin
MAHYLVIESRDPFTFADVQGDYDLTTGLAQKGNKVTLFLVENGVLPARRSKGSAALSTLAAGGVEVLADEFSLQERGIAADQLTKGVKAAPLDLVIDSLAAGCKAIWR